MQKEESTPHKERKGDEEHTQDGRKNNRSNRSGDDRTERTIHQPQRSCHAEVSGSFCVVCDAQRMRTTQSLNPPRFFCTRLLYLPGRTHTPTPTPTPTPTYTHTYTYTYTHTTVPSQALSPSQQLQGVLWVIAGAVIMPMERIRTVISGCVESFDCRCVPYNRYIGGYASMDARLVHQSRNCGYHRPFVVTQTLAQVEVDERILTISRCLSHSLLFLSLYWTVSIVVSRLYWQPSHPWHPPLCCSIARRLPLRTDRPATATSLLIHTKSRPRLVRTYNATIGGPVGVLGIPRRSFPTRT